MLRIAPWNILLNPIGPVLIYFPNSIFTDQAKGTSYWSLIDKLVQQVTLQQKDGANPDTEVAEIDVHKVVRQ